MAVVRKRCDTIFAIPFVVVSLHLQTCHLNHFKRGEDFVLVRLVE